MFCHQCGIKLNDGAAFCSSCGAPVIKVNNIGDNNNCSSNIQQDIPRETQRDPQQEIPVTDMRQGIPQNNINMQPNVMQQGIAGNMPNVLNMSNMQPNIMQPNTVTMKKSAKIIIVLCSAAAVLAVIFTVVWYFSSGFLINKADSLLQNNDAETAQKYLSFACPFGRDIDDVRQLSQNITDCTDLINAVDAAQAENDIITELNSSKKAYDLLPNYTITEEYFNESNQNFYNWLMELYNGGKYSEAAHAFAQLTEEVSTDETNALLAELRETYRTKAGEFLTSAQNYYNNYEPDKAAENVEIVLMLDSQNAEALALKANIDTYNADKSNIDTAQTCYNNKDYVNALTSFDAANDYTKTVHKALREQIVTAKYNQEIDNLYGSYVGTYSGHPQQEIAGDYPLYLGTETITITKIENGCIWINGTIEYGGPSDFVAVGDIYYYEDGISAAGGTIQIDSTGTVGGLDNKKHTLNEIRTITMKDGCLYVSCVTNGRHYYDVVLTRQ